MNLTYNYKHSAVAALRQTVDKIDGAYAPTTIRAYQADFAKFIDYCEAHGESALPAQPICVANYVGQLSKQYSSAFIRRIVVSISSVHRLNNCADPTKDPEVSLAVRRMHRQIGRNSHQAHAINKSLLDKMLNATEHNLRGVRDRALLQVAYDSLCRRSEIIALRYEDLRITQSVGSGKENASILLRRSKTDQEAQGKWLYIRQETLHAIQEWLDASEINSGLLFRGVNRGYKVTKGLGDGQIGRIYKRLVRTAGLDEKLAQHISGHSMRVGAAQDLMLSGASLPIIMARGRWSKPDTVMRYVEHTALPY
jgi:site-specific recombinase XerD